MHVESAKRCQLGMNMMITANEVEDLKWIPHTVNGEEGPGHGSPAFNKLDLVSANSEPQQGSKVSTP